MKKAKKIPLYVPVLWFVITVLWAITLCADIYYKIPSKGLITMHLCIMCVSLIIAVVNLIRYKKEKKKAQNQQNDA